MDEDLKPEQLILSRKTDITLGSVYVGRVADVKKNLKACFVNITPEIKGFLAFEDFEHAGLDIPHEGDIIVVRVLKEPVKTKGYSLSIDIEISGEYCVVSDHGNGIHYSKQLDGDEKEKINISEEDLEFELAKMGEQYNMSIEQIKNALGQQLSQFRNNLLMARIEDYLFANNQ